MTREEETLLLLEAGWERRGKGPKAIWRRPGGTRWWPHYRALIEMRGGRYALGEGPDGPGGAP